MTQGTVANHNFELLIAPTLAALANEPDVLVVATAGGRPVDAISGPYRLTRGSPAFCRSNGAAPLDVLVTNGGYGSVNQAMSFGFRWSPPG